MLHLISKSPVDPAIVERMASGDTAVLMDSAVLGVLKTGKLAALLAGHLVNKRFYVLAEDLAIRGIETARVIDGIEIIDYAGLVDLTVQNMPIHSWS